MRARALEDVVVEELVLSTDYRSDVSVSWSVSLRGMMMMMMLENAIQQRLGLCWWMAGLWVVVSSRHFWMVDEWYSWKVHSYQ